MGLLLSGVFISGWSRDPADDKPLVRLLVGGGFQSEPNEVLATIFGDGRFKTATGESHGSAAALVPLRTRLRRLQKVTQAGIDGQIGRSGIPEPAGRNATPRYGIEIRTPKGQIRILQIWSPKTYRNMRLSQVDTFLSALDAVAAFAGVKIEA